MKDGMTHEKICDAFLDSCDLEIALVLLGYDQGGAKRAVPHIEKSSGFRSTLHKRAEIFRMRVISLVARGERKKESIDAAERLVEYVKEVYPLLEEIQTQRTQWGESQ